MQIGMNPCSFFKFRYCKNKSVMSWHCFYITRTNKNNSTKLTHQIKKKMKIKFMFGMKNLKKCQHQLFSNLDEYIA